jgi:Terminase RNaseH-like domain
VSVEAGLMEMLDRMQTGRFKVFRHLLDWFEEFRLYHRKDGKVFKENDDLMSATRYGVMMLRYARSSAVKKAVDHYSGPDAWML